MLECNPLHSMGNNTKHCIIGVCELLNENRLILWKWHFKDNEIFWAWETMIFT